MAVSKRRSSTKEEENLGQEGVRGRRKPKLETVAESAYKEEEDDQVEEENNAQDQLEAGDDVDFEIEGEPQLGVELSHEEAMVKAVQYDLLKVQTLC